MSGWVTCPGCGGSGRFPLPGGWIPCGACGGSGRVPGPSMPSSIGASSSYVACQAVQIPTKAENQESAHYRNQFFLRRQREWIKLVKQVSGGELDADSALAKKICAELRNWRSFDRKTLEDINRTSYLLDQNTIWDVKRSENVWEIVASFKEVSGVVPLPKFLLKDKPCMDVIATLANGDKVTIKQPLQVAPLELSLFGAVQLAHIYLFNQTDKVNRFIMQLSGQRHANCNSDDVLLSKGYYSSWSVSFLRAAGRSQLQRNSQPPQPIYCGPNNERIFNPGQWMETMASLFEERVIAQKAKPAAPKQPGFDHP